MKKKVPILPALIFIILLQTSYYDVHAQEEQKVRFNIRVLGMDIGTLSVTERTKGTDTIIEATTDVKVRIVFTYRVKYIQHCTYRGGELWTSTLKTYKKDRLNSSTELINTGSEYMLIADEDTSYVHEKIMYSGSLLYFHEPSRISAMYYEISGEKKPVEKIGAHSYRITDPNNGRESEYHYEDGVLQRTSIEHRLATIYTERLKD